MNGRYILDSDKQPVEVESLQEWAQFMEDADRQVARTERGSISVSTIFLGLDHSFSPDGPPILFETMVFGGRLDQEQRRYSTWAEAIAGHKEMCVRVGF